MDYVKNIDKEDLKKLLREIVTPETVCGLSKRSARQELEKRLNLTVDALLDRRNEINEMIGEIVDKLNSADDLQDNGNDHNLSFQDDLNSTQETPRRIQNHEKSDLSDSASENSNDEGDETADDEDQENEKKERRGKRKLKSVSKSPNSINPPKNLKKTQSSVMSKAEFLETAKILKCQIGDVKFEMGPRKFGPGSCGWFYGGKIPVNVGKKEIWCQVGLNCTVLGSKEWPENNKKKKK